MTHTRTNHAFEGWKKQLLVAGFIVSAMVGSALLAEDGVPASLPEGSASADTQPVGFDRAYILPIKDEINNITYTSLQRRLNSIEADQPRLIIVELDTPGGALGATLEICHLLKSMRDEGVQVYAWINDVAYSAGTIIALATDGITMIRNATIGDCQPIMMVPGGGAAPIPGEIEAKATSPLREELEDSIRRNGYDYNMVMALIRPEMEIFWVENSDTGERRFVEADERDELFGLTDDKDKSDRRRGVLSFLRGDESDREDRSDSDDKSQTEWRYVESVPELQGEIRQPIVEADRALLTMRTDKALAYGFCAAVLKDEDDIRAHFGVTGELVRLENTWAEDIIEFLASPMVRSVLFLVMLLGAYTEMKAPGFGAPGGVAIVALVLFLGAPYLAGYTVTWEIVAIVAGIILLLVEVFVIPGFGIAGITGIILLMVGLLASYVPSEPFPDKDWFELPSMQSTYDYFRRGLYSLALGLTGSVVGMVLIAKYLPYVPVAGRIIAPNPRREEIEMDDPYEGVARVGDIGKTESLLRPAGKARFGALLVDVVSEGEYILKGIRVEVVERHGNRVVVRRVD